MSYYVTGVYPKGEDNLNMKNKQMTSNLILLMVAAIWGGGFIAGKMALTGLEPWAVIAYRYGMGAVLCLVIFWKRVVQSDREIIRKGIVIGLVQAIGQAVQLIGLQYTSSANQSFLCSAYVAFVPFISWIMIGKRPEGKAFFAGVIALTGIGLISLKDSFTIGIGDSLSVLFAVIFGIQIVLIGKIVDKNTDVAALTFFQMMTAAVAGFIICIFKGELTFDIGGEAVFGVVYLGVLNTFIAFTAQNYAQKYARDTTAALIMSMESLFGFLFSVLYYKEIVTAKFLMGSILCFVAVLINTAEKRRKLQ